MSWSTLWRDGFGFVRHPLGVANSSSLTSESLLVISDADSAYPVIVDHIASPTVQHKIRTLVGKDTYKYKNCYAAYSPLAHAALIITRSGTVKLINCSTGTKTWEIAEIGEFMDVGDGPGSSCSLGFSKCGTRALALDRKGKVLVADFV
jgi:hypothetical protein